MYPSIEPKASVLSRTMSCSEVLEACGLAELRRSLAPLDHTVEGNDAMRLRNLWTDPGSSKSFLLKVAGM